MRKFILGLLCGIVLAGSSAAFAASAIKAVWFNVHYEINGSPVPASSNQAVNIEGHVYVPLRLITDNLGATTGYDAEQKSIQIKNGALDLADPDYPEITAGNLVLTKSGSSTLVAGQLKLANVGNTLHKIVAILSFYNDDSRQIGQITITGDTFGVNARLFSVLGSGDFRNYTSANLYIKSVDDKVISQPPAITYENSKYHFTLQLPAYWKGKYSVRSSVIEASNDSSENSSNGSSDDSSKTEAFTFVNTANQVYGGDVFTVLVWSKQAWREAGPSMKEVGRIWKIGEQGDKIFTLNPPGDVQYNPEDKALTAEYKRMSSYIDQIRTSFKLQGGK